METSPIKKYLIYQTINNICILTPFSFIKASNKFNKFYISIHDIDRPSKLYIKGISFSLFKRRLKINTEEYLKHSYVLTNLNDHVYGVAYIYNSVDNSIYRTDLSNIVNNLFNIKIKTNEFIRDKCTLTDILVIDKDHKYIYTSITL